MQGRISKIRNFLPFVPEPIKIGGIVHDIKEHDILDFFKSALIPFKYWSAHDLVLCFILPVQNLNQHRERELL